MKASCASLKKQRADFISNFLPPASGGFRCGRLFIDRKRVSPISKAEIPFSCPGDYETVLALDPYFSPVILQKKPETSPEQNLLLFCDDKPAGLLCWHLFWDYIPYTHYLHIPGAFRARGFAKQLLTFLENAMQQEGWPTVMASIPSDAPAQYFYRRMGYRDAGCFLLNEGPLRQAPELFFIKQLSPGNLCALGLAYADCPFFHRLFSLWAAVFYLPFCVYRLKVPFSFCTFRKNRKSSVFAGFLA